MFNESSGVMMDQEPVVSSEVPRSAFIDIAIAGGLGLLGAMRILPPVPAAIGAIVFSLFRPISGVKL